MCMGHFQGEIPVIPAFLLLGEKPIPFLPIVDTGCTRTILSYQIAEIAGIDLKSLRKEQIGGIGGKSYVRELNREISIGLLDEEAGGVKKIHVEPLDYVYFFEKKDEKNPSLVGWDILSRFELCFNKQQNDINLKRLNVLPKNHKILIKS